MATLPIPATESAPPATPIRRKRGHPPAGSVRPGEIAASDPPPRLASLDSIPRGPDGFPDHMQIPNIYDYMEALAPEQWSQQLPKSLRVDGYLYLRDPLPPWIGNRTISLFVEKLSGPITREYIANKYGGHRWEIQINRGEGKNRTMIYNQIEYIADPPKDLSAILAQKTGGTMPAPSNGTVAAPAAESADLRLSQMMLAEMKEMREEMRAQRGDPWDQARKTVEMQRELLATPKKDDGLTTADLFRLLREERESAFKMAKEMFGGQHGGAAPSDPMAVLTGAMRLLGVIKENAGDLIGTAEPKVESSGLKIAEVLVKGAGTLLDKGSDFMERATVLQRTKNNGQRTPIDVPAQPDPAASARPVQTAAQPAPGPPPVPASDWDIRKRLIGKLVCNYFPKAGEEYDQQGYDAADMAHDTDAEIAKFMAEHLLKGDDRPVDAILDPLFAPLVNHPHLMAFGQDYIAYFFPPEPEPSEEAPHAS